MVERGPGDGADRGTTPLRPSAGRRRTTYTDDGDTVIIPAVQAQRRPLDDDATQLLRPVHAGTRPVYPEDRQNRQTLQNRQVPTRPQVATRPPTRTRPETRMPDPAAERRRHRREPAAQRPRRLRRFFKVTGLVLVLLLAGFGGMAYGQWQKIESNISKVQVAALPDKPAPAVPQAMNILLIGSDSRISKGDPAKGWVAGEQRADSMMLVHIAKDRKNVDVVSIPRDTWVDIPDQGPGKINSAYTYGGPSRLVQTVNMLSPALSVDHMVIMDFTGFKAMTDALGGVTLTVPKATGDSKNWFRAGTYKMSGKQALGYVRQRHNLPNGDFDRMKRQQNWIRAVVKQALSRNTLTNPLKLNAFLVEATKSVTVDEHFSTGEMTDLALSLKSLNASDIRFMTMPNLGVGWEGDQSIVRIDDVKAASLLSAMADDQVTDWLEVHKPELLEEIPR
jgi:LCP family protein required for cell wall assembly